MLARYMLASCVYPSVCHKPVLYRNDWTNRAGFWQEGLLSPHCVIRKFGYLRKLGYFPPRHFFPYSGLSKFRRGNSIALSTKLVVVVDGQACWRHLYDSRRVVAVYYKSVNCNPLTRLWICCTTCFYSWRDFDWHGGPSAVAEFLVYATRYSLRSAASHSILSVVAQW